MVPEKTESGAPLGQHGTRKRTCSRTSPSRSTSVSTGSSIPMPVWKSSTRGAAGPKARLFPGRSLSRLERHPERPDDALRRDLRRGQRVPAACRLHERQYRRPARVGSSPASMATGASRARSTTASITVIARHYDGKRLNSPNDVGGEVGRLDLVHRSGLRHRHRLRRPQGGKRDRCLPRLPGRSRPPARSRIVADDFVRPNGIAFSLDETQLYVSDTGCKPCEGRAAPYPRLRRLGERQADRRKGLRRRARAGCSTVSGSTTTGRLWTSAGDGVHCYDPDGTLIGKVLVPGSRRERRLWRTEAQPPLSSAARRRSMRSSRFR